MMGGQWSILYIYILYYYYMIVMDCQSGYSYHQQDKQILGGCLRNREGQAAVQ